MTDNHTTPGHCPTCHAPLAADTLVCRQCGTILTDRVQEELHGEDRRQSISTSVGLETLLIVAILVAILVAIWMLRPEAQLAGGVASQYTPTPLPTSTATLTRAPTRSPTMTATPEATPTPSFYIHKVAPGDTLIGIAIQYGVRLDRILETNNISEDDFLSIGQELVIPLGEDVDLPTPTPTRLPGLGFNIITHTIQAGDTLLDIALAYDTTIRDIVAANDLSGPDEILVIGDVLVIPSGASPTPMTPTQSPTRQPTDTPRPSPTPAEPSPTPRFTMPAPTLLSPPDGALVTGDMPLLSWVSAGVLDDDSWYRLQLWTARPGEPEFKREAWVKATSWRLSDDLAPKVGTTQRYRWDVVVVRRNGDGEKKDLSPSSEIRSFRWER